MEVFFTLILWRSESQYWRNIIGPILQRKRSFSEPIFPGDPGSLTLTQGHVQSLSIYTLPSLLHNLLIFRGFLTNLDDPLQKQLMNDPCQNDNISLLWCADQKNVCHQSEKKTCFISDEPFIYTLPKQKHNSPCCVSFEGECSGYTM